jgi:hypothetical protein
MVRDAIAVIEPLTGAERIRIEMELEALRSAAVELDAAGVGLLRRG